MIAPGQSIEALDMKKGFCEIQSTNGRGGYLPDTSGFSMTLKRGAILTSTTGVESLVKNQPRAIFEQTVSYFRFEVFKASAVRINSDALTDLSGSIELDYKMKEADLGVWSATCWKVGKVDAMTGIAWNNGVVLPQAHSSGIKIQDELGKVKDLSAMVSFRITGKVP